MKVLVTGGAGFIGSHLVEALLARGDEVTAIDCFDPFYSRDVKERNLANARRHRAFTFVEGELLDHSTLSGRMTPETVVVHLAGRPGVRPSFRDPRGYLRANVEATLAVVQAMQQAGASRLVFGSSSSVYGNTTLAPFPEDAAVAVPISPYAASKRAAELFLISMAPALGLRVASLRYFTVFGPRQRPDLAIHAFALRMRQGQPLTLFGDGSQARDYTYCDDIVRGTVAAADWTGQAPVGVEIINLGGSHPIPLREMVSTLSAALRMTPELSWLPMQTGDVEQTFADITKAGRLLGYAPTVSFAAGIERFVHWFQAGEGGESWNP